MLLSSSPPVDILSPPPTPRLKRDIGHDQGPYTTSQAAPQTEIEDLDVLIIGAGFAGCYLIHNLRKHNFKARIAEAGSNLGGVWNWNRYPGCRTDSPYPVYALSLPEVWRDWTWKEKYPCSEEMREYFAHMDRVLDISKDVDFDTKVEAAEFDAQTDKWTVRYSSGRKVRTSFLIAAIGFSARRHFPDWPGLDSFKGTIHHSSFWPAEEVDVKGKRIAVVGTGATGIQIAQECSKQIGDAGALTLFQRTPNICYPMRQCKLTKEQQDDDKQHLADIFRDRSTTPGGFAFKPLMKRAMEAAPEEREAFFESLWQSGGFGISQCNYHDIMLDSTANKAMYDFWLRKTRPRINDPRKRELLAPLNHPHCFGGKRSSLEQDLYEQFNRPNVDVVDTRTNPVAEVVPEGIKTQDGTVHDLDIIALATGFDAVTGGVRAIQWHGTHGETLDEIWEEGTLTYLGMGVPKLPNMMMLYGPQSPTAFANGPSCVEPQADWVVDLLLFMRCNGQRRIETSPKAAELWKEDTYTRSALNLRHHVDGWYNGGNIPGKRKEPMNWTGGLHNYITKLREVAASGYNGFEIR